MVDVFWSEPCSSTSEMHETMENLALVIVYFRDKIIHL